MTMHELLDEIGRAELTKTASIYHDGHSRLVAVWHGGTTVNVYTVVDSYAEETDVWNISDEKGRPLNREQMQRELKAYLAKQRQ